MKFKSFLIAYIAPILASVIWGAGFVAQSHAGVTGAFTINAGRSFIAVVFLLGLTLIFTKGDFKHILSEKDPKATKTLWIGGTIAGIGLFLAAFMQQQGLNMGVESGKAGFLTSLYVVLVAVFSIFVGKKPSPTVWISVVLAMGGLYFLSVSNGFSVSPADLVIIGCAIIYTVQIMALDKFAPMCNTTKLSTVMFLVCAVLSLIFALIFDRNVTTYENFLEALPSIAFLGIFSSGIAYTLQVLAQSSDENPAAVTVLLSLESVFSVIFGAIIDKEVLKPREYIGCALMFAAVMLNVLLESRAKRKK